MKVSKLEQLAQALECQIQNIRQIAEAHYPKSENPVGELIKNWEEKSHYFSGHLSNEVYNKVSNAYIEYEKSKEE